jgi:type I restriction enzyme S subunit
MGKLKNIPSLRFSEFKEEWEKKKLGDIGDVKMCRRIFNDETLSEGDIPFFKIGSFGKVADAFITKQLFLEYREKFSYPKKGNVLISAAGTIGRLVVYNGEDAYYQDSNIVWIENEGTLVTDKYLFYTLQHTKFKTEGGTIQRLYNSILKSTKFSCSTLKEQTKIATFLTAVDEKLQALKQKKMLLERYKKGVMQKIFSQELRFKDDNGNEYPAWVQKKLGEVLVKNSKKNKNQEFKLVQSVSNKRGFVNQDEYFEDRIIASKDLSNYYVIQKGDFAYNPSRIDVGSLAYKFDNNTSVISPLYISFKAVGSSLVDAFLLEWFTTQQFTRQMNSSFEGSVRNTLSYESLRKIDITFPCIEEQTKIANFLSVIDDKINHCQGQVEKTEVWKKGLLQQMFC